MFPGQTVDGRGHGLKMGQNKGIVLRSISPRQRSRRSTTEHARATTWQCDIGILGPVWREPSDLGPCQTSDPGLVNYVEMPGSGICQTTM